MVHRVRIVARVRVDLRVRLRLRERAKLRYDVVRKGGRGDERARRADRRAQDREVDVRPEQVWVDEGSGEGVGGV